jgi:hypothetical protein
LRRGVALAALLALACDLGGDVDHRGRYGFLPGQGPVSTAPLPLRRLLVVESDASADRTRFYLFEGELGSAGIGVEDLRKLALGFNRFDMSFTPPIESPTPAGEGGAGGGDSGGAEVAAPPAEPLTLELDAESVELRALTSEELAAAGAGRFSSALEGTGFRVRAYFGARAGAASFERLSVAGVSYERALSAIELRTELVEAKLAVDYGDPQGLDYLELELSQPLLRTEDEQPLDAGVITRMWSGTVYAPSFELLGNVFAQGCWSLDAPLRLRSTQYAQSYSARPGGDFAVLERRTDQIELAPEDWNEAIGEVPLAGYCAAFERGR